MKNNPIVIGVIGAGARCQVLLKHLVKQGAIHVHSVFDPSNESIEGFKKAVGQSDFARVENFRKITEHPDIPWVIIASPNAMHADQILSAFENGKHVFTEKPLATDIEDCWRIQDAHEKAGVHFATGFVLRYAPLALKMKEELDSGRYGKILQVSANENITPAHGGYIMRGWRRFRELSGPHILEKCCHDMDLLYWFTGHLPTKIAAFAGNDFFIPENENLLAKYKEGGVPIFNTWAIPDSVDDPFTSEKDTYDNYVASMVYGDSIRVQFQATMSNAIPERRISIQCTEGNLVLEFYSATLKTQTIEPGSEMQEFTFEGSDLHGGGDEKIMQSLYKTMTEGFAPACGGREGLYSAVCALAIDEAAQTGEIKDLSSLWASLKVTP